MVVFKEITKIPRGKSYFYRINLAIKDNLDGKVVILTIAEYKELNNKVIDCDELKKENNELHLSEKDNNKLIKENTELYHKIKTIEKKLTVKYQKTIAEQDKEINRLSNKLENIEQNHNNILQNIKNQYKENYNKLEEKNKQLHEDKEKCISLNSSLITDFKHILNFGFLDLIRKKHKTTIETAIKKEIPDKNKEFKAVLLKDR
jgi:predicted carbohydrate-binding protein with CBM5 and CBM33 domain